MTMQAQLTEPNILPYILAGKAIFTIRNPSTGRSFTYRIKQPKDCSKWFIAVLTGPDNTSNYTYIGFLNERKEYIHGRNRSPISEGAPSVMAFKWFFNNLKDLKGVECFHSGRCARCGRVLTVVESVTSGLGPECRKAA